MAAWPSEETEKLSRADQESRKYRAETELAFYTPKVSVSPAQTEQFTRNADGDGACEHPKMKEKLLDTYNVLSLGRE